MQTDILIIGGGLSGLIATWQLQYAGKNASVMEARTRFGGRILTTRGDDGIGNANFEDITAFEF